MFLNHNRQIIQNYRNRICEIKKIILRTILV